MIHSPVHSSFQSSQSESGLDYVLDKFATAYKFNTVYLNALAHLQKTICQGFCVSRVISHFRMRTTQWPVGWPKGINNTWGMRKEETGKWQEQVTFNFFEWYEATALQAGRKCVLCSYQMCMVLVLSKIDYILTIMHVILVMVNWMIED